jgi:hypothetical protein
VLKTPFLEVTPLRSVRIDRYGVCGRRNCQRPPKPNCQIATGCSNQVNLGSGKTKSSTAPEIFFGPRPADFVAIIDRVNTDKLKSRCHAPQGISGARIKHR